MADDGRLDPHLMRNIRENTEKIRRQQEQDASLGETGDEPLSQRIDAYIEGSSVEALEAVARKVAAGFAAEEILPTDAQARKDIPLVTGLLDYFPAALAEIAKVSKAGNDKHNPGEPMHWARAKSMDQADCIGRHLLERGGIDPETGQRHSAQMAWRALALLQLELEAAGAPMARGARE